MAVPVDIFVTDESVVPLPLVGVEVGIFNPNTHILVSSATTDGSGKASFLLPGSVTPGTAYEVRFYKLGVNFHGLRTIRVLDPATSVNKFDHTGADSNLLPLSGSSTLCCCTGVFTDPRGQPMANKSIRFSARGNTLDRTPKVWNIPSRVVGTDAFEVMTDTNGRVSVNLIRNTHMLVTWGGDGDQVWDIYVPDRDSVNLIDLIHPFPLLLDWDDTLAPSDAVSLAALAQVELPVTLTKTDYSTDDKNLSALFDFVNSDGTKVEATYDDARGLFVLRGIAAGSATITPQLKSDYLPNRWPVPTVTAPVLTITVTP